MHIAMSNALALMSWHEFKFLHGDFAGGGFVWLLIGFSLAIVVISSLAVDAALVLHAPDRLQSRITWSVDASESTVTVSPSQAKLDDCCTPTQSKFVRNE